MQLPERMPARPLASDLNAQPRSTERESPNSVIEPAGCCLEVCGPLGCTCLYEAPFC